MTYVRFARIIFVLIFLSPFTSLLAGALGEAEKYNGFFLETFRAPSSLVEGRLAAGGIIKVNNYTVADKLPPSTAGMVLVAGSDLEYLSGELYFGNAIAAGSIRRVGNSVFKRLEAGQSIQGEQPLPFDFGEQFVLLRDASIRLAQSPVNGESAYQSDGVYLKGDCQSPVQIFTIDGAKLLTADTFEVSCIPDDATIIFNINGEATGFDRVDFSTLTNHREKILYNFYQATSLLLNKVDIEGSILAPYADIFHPKGVIYGSVMAKSWDGRMRLLHHPFTGNLGFLSNPPEIISTPIFYVDEKVDYDYQVEAIDPDFNEQLTYSLDLAPKTMSIDPVSGEIDWVADASYVASTATFNSQCYIVPEGAIEVLKEGDVAQTGHNYIAPLFLRVKEAISTASSYTGPAAVDWDKSNNCLGCHIQTQTLLGLATSQDKADVDQDAINYLLNELLTSQQADGTIRQSHPEYSITQTVMALWSLSDGLNPDVTFPIRARALDYLWSRKQGTTQAYWVQDHNTGWMNNNTATSAMLALSVSRFLTDAETQILTVNQQKTVDNFQSILTNMAEYFLASYKNSNNEILPNAFQLIALSELTPHITDSVLLNRIEEAQQFLDNLLRSSQLDSGGWNLLKNGTVSDPLISSWVGLALNYLHPALTDAAVLKNITFLLDSQAANGTWSTPSRLYTTPLGTTSLVMSYLPVALEHLGNPDLRVSDIILTEQEQQPHLLSATVSNRGLGDVTSEIVAEFFNGNNELLGSANIDNIRSGLKNTVTIKVNEADLNEDVYVRLSVAKEVEECQIGNNEVKAAIVKARVTDFYGHSDTQIFSVNVNDVNEAPTIISQPTIEHQQGQEYLYQVQVSDVDLGDAAKFELIDPPIGLYVDERTGQIFSNPEQLQPGDYSITVQVIDLAGLTTTQTFNLVVKTNQAPIITSNAIETGLEKAGYNYQVIATDPNPNDVLTYGLEISNSGMSIDKNSGLLNWQAESSFVEPLIIDNGLCEAQPNVITDFNVTEKWKWEYSNGNAANIYGPVVVGQLSDDNEDGLINSDDNTDILFFTDGGILKAVDGATGIENLSVSLGFSILSSPAIADIDGDSRPEIVAVGKNRQKLFLLEDDGTKIWEAVIPSLYKSSPRDGVSIADLDADGNPEIILGNLVYSNTGQLLWKGKYDTGGEASYGIVSAVEDIDLDGFYEVIAGRTVYRHDGTTYWNRSDLIGSGFNAVGNFDEDDQAEIVLISNSKVYLLDTDGSTIWGPVSIPGGGFGGAPTIADVDNDGIPEIAVAGANYYSLFNHKGEVLWSRKTVDASSNRTGSSFFDFEGDGKSEVLYADEYNFYIFDGLTGNVRYKRANRSGTVLEYPVVADVDNDGHAEIVIGENTSSTSGLRVLEGAPEWVPTRRIWNQYSYSINNINDDLSVPLIPTHPWLTHNTFRLNTFLDRPALAQADLVVHSIRYDATSSQILATVKNRGLATSTGTSVEFFHEHFWTGEAALDAVAVGTIEAGAEIEISIDVDDATIIETIRAEINRDKTVVECSYDNNIAKAAIVEARVYDEGKLWDKQKFAISIKNENDAPQIVSLKTSQGSEGSNYRFQVEVSDPDLGDAFTYQLSNDEMNFSINAKTGEITASELVQGSYLLTISATDLAGLTAEQYHVVTVSEASNNPPYFITHPDLQVNVGEQLSYQVIAEDPENDLLFYILAQAPASMEIDSETGQIIWVPDNTQVGDAWVSVTALDTDGASATESFTISVIDPFKDNIAPAIISIPAGAIYEGKQFEYQIIAEDDQPLTELSYQLENKVAGMALSDSGLFTWLPTSVQAGQTFTIIVKVTDAQNATATQNLSLPVNHSANNPPTITSQPSLSIIQDSPYEYLVKAEDKDGDTWTTQLLEGPNGLTLTGNTLHWTPSSKQVGTQHPVKLQVEDARGAISTQSFTVWVNAPAINNDAPTILSAPSSPAMVGNSYQYQMVVTDPENDLISYQLVQSVTGMRISEQGLLTWTPIAEQIGEHDVIISLTDSVNTLTHSFTLAAVAASDPLNPNNYPVINSLPSTQASTQNSYNYQVDATDADGDLLSYTLTKAPDGMAIDSTGLISWQASDAQQGTHAVKVSVSDGKGSSLQSYTVAVSDNTQPLTVSIVFTPQIITSGESLTATIVEQGGSGTAIISATLDGQAVTINAQNKLLINTSTVGSHSVTVTVIKGEESLTESANFFVQDGTDTTPPVITITSPEHEANISAPTPLMGSITDNNLKDYKVMISAKGKQQWSEIATGTTQVIDSQIAVIDPTLLINGFYDVVVIATDINGAETQDGITINVEGNLKVGNFSFTVTDLEIPLAGIPIQVTRTYDSRRRSEDLDFGFGWSIAYKDIKLEESRSLAKGWSLNKYTSGFMGTKVDWCVEPQGQPTVSVTLPNGHQEQFAVEASPKCSAYVPTIDVTLAFKPLNNTQSKLQLKNKPLLRLNGSEVIIMGSGSEYDPNDYLLTTKEGFVYHINQQAGIDKVDDPYGNTLTYTENGIFHSNGQSIQFKRNAKGHIEKLIDHNGKERIYSYDENLDLEKAANFANEATRYTYHEEHALKDILDPLNRRLLTNHYDEAGRLYKQVDNDGLETLFDHDVDGRQSVITDRRGNSTTYYYDDKGNVLSQFDAYNNETTYEYWPNDEKKIERKYGQSGLVSEIYYEVDQSNRDITLINDNGRITKYDYQYNADGSKVETITDPELKVFVNHYDPAGNIYRIVFPATEGGVSKEAGSQINAKGQVDWAVNSEGEKTSFTYYSGGIDDSRKKTETDAENNVTTFTYDENGNVASESANVTVEGTLTTVLTQYFYDAQNRLIKTIHADGLSTETVYDAAGNVDYTLDKRGRKTDYLYDLYGKLEETLYPDGTMESKTYDLEGNLETATDTQNRITSYEYDELNRLTATRFPDGSSTEIQYDALGNVESQWDENGNQTIMRYDGSGRLEYSQDARGNKHRYDYDSNNNLKSETDKNGHVTFYNYNALGQKVSTELADGQLLQQSFDTLGRKLTSQDQEGKITRYTYDKMGRLETVTQSLDGNNLVTRYSYDEMGNKLTQEDALNRVTTWTYDKLGRVQTRTLPEGMSESFTYDDLGNVKTHTDFNNKTTTYYYHPLSDRLQRVDYEDGNFEQYTYYDAGQISTITNVDGIVNYQYDLRDRLTQETKVNGDSLAYDYDAVGNRTAVTTTVNGESVTTTSAYNSLNQLIKVVAPDSTETTYSYDNAGNQKTVTVANGLITTYHYDTLNRLDDMAITDATDTVVESYDYVLTDSGRRAQVIEGNGRIVDYNYDDLYRLTSETVTDLVNGDHTATYNYDNVGNRINSIVNGVSTTYSYDDNDRLLTAGATTYGYDDQGNQLTVTEGSNLTEQNYNALNKLISSQVNSEPEISFSYDANGIRVSRTHNGITTQYLVDHNRDYAQVLAETENGSLSNSYVYGHDLISQERAGNNSFYLTDGLGSTRLLADDATQITDRYDYAAFGELLQQTGSTENSYRYTGEQYDAGLDNYYLRARYYNQNVGRFTQQDSWLGVMQDPTTLHKYLYAGNDPISYVDPTGYFFTLQSLMAGTTGRNNLATTSAGNGARYYARALWGEAKDAIKDELTDQAFGLVGEMVVEYMARGLESGLARSGALDKPNAIGTRAHKDLDDLIKADADKLTKRLKAMGLGDLRIESELFRDKLGRPSARNVQGSMGLDIVILKGNKVILAFDMKTGKAGTAKKKGRKYQDRFNFAPIIDIFISRK